MPPHKHCNIATNELNHTNLFKMIPHEKCKVFRSINSLMKITGISCENKIKNTREQWLG